jgi:hypothetical protein
MGRASRREAETIPGSKRSLLWVLVGALAVIVVAGAAFYFYRSHPTVSDASIVQDVKAKLHDDTNLREYTIDVTVQGGTVTLAGSVNTDADKTKAVQIAQHQDGVKAVIDNLSLPKSNPPSPQSASITVPGNQAWTATGVFLNAGAVVEISASGGVSFSRGSNPMPPAGDPPDCLTVANGPYGWRAAPYVANQLPCSSLLGRVGENGVAFYVGGGTTFRAATPGQLYLGVNDNDFSDNSGFWTATIAVKANPPIAGAEPTWLGFANGTVAQDRDVELRRNCGDFKRVYVPDSAGNRFPDLCGSVAKTCEKVCDWQGGILSCDAVSLGGNRDGTRVALCR